MLAPGEADELCGESDQALRGAVAGAAASDGAVTGISSHTVTSTAAADESSGSEADDGGRVDWACTETRTVPVAALEEPGLTGGAASYRALAASGSKQAGAAPSASDSGRAAGPPEP